MELQIPRTLWLVWICSLMRGLFYASMLPLWEGYDEWSHFAYVQHIATTHELPNATTPVSLEVQESLKLVPLHWELRNYLPPHITHDAFWKLPDQERSQRSQDLRSLPPEWGERPGSGEGRIYETQQPPLYYWLMSWPLRLLSSQPLAARVMLLRWINVAIASLFVPLGFLMAKRVFRHEGLALGVVALSAAMPELLANVCRVGSDGLALGMYTALCYLALKIVDTPERSGAAASLGLVLGLGLLTKVYFLTAVPALLLVLASAFWCNAEKRQIICKNAALAVCIALALAGGWFWHNLQLTGRWSGLHDDVAVKDLSLWERLHHLPNVDWGNALDSIFLSHIWMGNWSLLQVRAWIYHLFALLTALALAGLAVWVMGGKRKLFPETNQVGLTNSLLVLGALYGFFWLGLAYHVLLITLVHGYSTSAGWYLYCLVVAEVILASWGLQVLCPTPWRRFVVPTGVIFFTLLDLYATHFILIPYYMGLIFHRLDGSVTAFHISQLHTFGLGEILARLATNKPSFLGPSSILAIWALYLAATVGLVAISLWASRKQGASLYD